MFGSGTSDDIIIKIGADIKEALVGIRKVDMAVDRMDANVGKAAAGIRGATGKMIKAFTAVGVVATIGLAVAVGKATMTFADFEQAVTNAASVTGKSGPEYEAVKKNIEELSKTLGETTVFSAQQAASAMYDLASAGYDVGTMVKSDLEPIMNLAAATQADLTFATETVTSTLGQFGLGIEDSAKVSDVFAKTIGSSKATLEKLALSMRYVGPVAHSLGMDIEDVNAMLGQLYNAGFKGEQAGTAMRTAMSKLMVPTKAVRDVLENIGLTYDQVNPATHDFADTLELLQKQGLDTNAAMQLFGIEAAPAMISLMANTTGVKELEAALRDAGGAAADMATKQLDTLKGSLTLLKSAFEGLMISVGEMAAPAVKDFAVKLKDAIPHIKTMIEEGLVKLKQIIKDLAPTWKNLSLIINSAKGIFKDIFTAISSGNTDTKTFTDIINTLTGALAKVFAWIDKHPEITKLAVTIGLAAVAFSYILPIVVSVVGAVSGLIGFIGTLAGAIGGATTVMGAISAVIAVLGGPITVIIGIIALLAAAWTTNFLGIRDKTKWAVEQIGKIFNKIKDVFLLVVDSIKTNIEKVPGPLKLLLGPIGAIVYAFENWDKIKDIIGGIVDVLKNPSEALDSLKEGFTSKLEKIKGTLSNFAKDHERELKVIGGAILTVATGGGWLIWKHNIGGIQEKTAAAWDFIKEKTADLFNWLQEQWGKLSEIVESALNAIISLLESIMDPIKRVGVKVFEFWKAGLLLAYDTIVKPYIDQVIKNITTMLDIGTKAYDWGKNLLDSFIDGIKSKFKDLKNSLKNIAEKIADYIAIESPAKIGPLADLMKWGPNLTKTFADGIKANIPLINTAMKDLSPSINMQDMNKTTPGTGVTNIYNVNTPITIKDIVIREEADIDRIITKIETQLADKVRSVSV